MIIPELRHRRITNANVDVLRRTLNDKLRRLIKEIPMERRETLTIDISRYETINNTGLSALLHARSEALAAGFTEVQLQACMKPYGEKFFLRGSPTSLV